MHTPTKVCGAHLGGACDRIKRMLWREKINFKNLKKKVIHVYLNVDI